MTAKTMLFYWTRMLLKMIAMALVLALTSTCLFALSGPDMRGIQVPLFAAWDDSSLDLFIETVAVAQPHLPSNRFEIALMYMTDSLPGHDDSIKGPHRGAARGRWDNLKRVIDCLGVSNPPPTCPAFPSSPIDLKVRVFFGLHQFSGANESEDKTVQAKDIATMQGFVTDFNKNVLAVYGPKIVFRLSPLLEDTFQSATSYAQFAQAIFGKLDAANVCGSIYPRLIRSRQPDDKNADVEQSPDSVSVTVKCPSSTKATTKSIPVQHEWHGIDVIASRYDAWSPDGFFVYDSNKEDNRNTDIAGDVELDTYIKTANAKKTVLETALLWRPRYNLHSYKNVTTKKCDATPPPRQSKLAYCSGIADGTIADRVSATQGAVFDAYEASILAKFLKAQ
jgi:hypothetical protein